MRNYSLVAVSALAFVLSIGPAQAHTRKAIWGPELMPDGPSALPIYRALGVRYLQLLNWSVAAPSRPDHPTDPADPAYQWPSSLDRTIRAARKMGVRIALMLSASPSWANGGRSQEWVPRNRDYSDFVTAAARRYRGVRHWMIWGEANRTGPSGRYRRIARSGLVATRRCCGPAIGRSSACAAGTSLSGG
jgi:hypothetical protein